MKYIEKTCEQFTDELASKSPVPGGGGACAMAAALGVALSMMVGNLTTGKQSYADVEADILKLLEKAEKLKSRFLALVDEDAKAFAPLAKAYGIPKDDPSRQQAMEDALRLACTVPLEVMRLSAEAIELCDTMSKIGSRLALSDAGVSAVFLKAALQGAGLNIFINAKYMDNRGYVKKLEAEVNDMLQKYCFLADEIYSSVAMRLR